LNTTNYSKPRIKSPYFNAALSSWSSLQKQVRKKKVQVNKRENKKIKEGVVSTKKRASPRRIKSRPFIHCLLTPKKLNSRMSLASSYTTYLI